LPEFRQQRSSIYANKDEDAGRYHRFRLEMSLGNDNTKTGKKPEQ